MENQKEEIKIIDDNDDKKYFTIVPNYIINHSTADEKALYLEMKRIAGENNECFATQETLGKQLGWSRKKVGIMIQKLLKREWIVSAGTKVFRTSPVKVYRIVDLWKQNIDFYQKKRGVKMTHLSEDEKRDESKELSSEESKTPKEEEPLLRKITLPKGKAESNPYGNEDVNKIISCLKESFKLSVLDGSDASNRKFAWLLYKKAKQNTEAICFLIRFASQHSWWLTKIASVKDLYYNIVKISLDAKGQMKNKKEFII